MVLELHIWGPAFSLPSIDAQCLAAVAYLKQAVPGGEWVLVASSDPTISPTRDLPALCDGPITVGGFQNIVEYLRKVSDGRWDLETNLSPIQKADSIAFTSYIGSHGQSLLDLSLYVSTENFISITRPAYSQFLQLPDTWILPPQRRAEAKARTAHLGLSSLDIDTANEEQKRDVNTVLGSEQIPQSLRRSKQTVTSLLKQPQHAARFQLDALIEGFCEPLQDLLARKKYFFSNEYMSSLDCLALGYLSLAIVPEVPQTWLADTMKEKYQGLYEYMKNGVEDCFGGKIDVKDALLKKPDNPTNDARPTSGESKKALPWREPTQKGFTSSGRVVLQDTFGSLPFAGIFQQKVLTKADSKATTHDKALLSSSQQRMLPAVFAVGSAVAAMASYLFYSGFFTFSTIQDDHCSVPEKRSLSDMGEAGAMLATANFRAAEVEMARMQALEMERKMELERNRSEGLGVVPVVEVDVEVAKNNKL